MTISSNNRENRPGTIFANIIVQGNNGAFTFTNVYQPAMNMYYLILFCIRFKQWGHRGNS